MHNRKAIVTDLTSCTTNIYCIGDVHVGSEACIESNVSRLASIIAEDPDARIIGLGDYIEAIAPSDWRFDPSEVKSVPDDTGAEYLNNIIYAQAVHFSNLFSATKGKWLAVLSGNHESVAARKYHFDAAAIIAHQLGAKYLGGSDESGWLRLMVKKHGKTRRTIDAYLQHGWGGGELRGGDALKLQRLAWRKNADLVLYAHTHRPMALPETVEYVDSAGTVRSQTRWAVICYPTVGKHGYIARRGGNAPSPGYTVITIRCESGNRVSIGVEMREL